MSRRNPRPISIRPDNEESSDAVDGEEANGVTETSRDGADEDSDDVEGHQREEEPGSSERWCDPTDTEGEESGEGNPEEEEAEAEEEHAEQPALRDPGQPTQAQVDAHMLTYVPFRPW